MGTALGPEARQPTGPAPPLAPVPDSRRLSRLLEDAQARRGRLGLEIAEAERALAGLEADRRAARAAFEEAAADQRDLGAQRAQLLDLLATAHDEARRAEAQVASAAAVGRTTPVARPPARGDTPADQQARARQAASDALRRTIEVTGLLHEQLGQFQAAGERARVAGARADALSEQVGAAQEAVAALRQRMAEVADDLAASVGLLDALAATSGPSALAVADIPPPMLELYRRAAEACSGLSWTVLAAIGSVETSHGRAELPGVRTGANSAGAMGPMQFLGATWAAYGADGDGDGRRDVYNPADAVFGAARYLCDGGAGQPSGLAPAIWAYNHADWYVQAVLEVAAGYGAVGLAVDPAAAAALVERPSLILSSEARSDILDGTADARLVALLAAASARHTVAVSVIRRGHSKHVAGTDRVSNHYYGRAVDIYAVDGAPVSASNQAAFELALAILASGPEIRPVEFGSPWTSLAGFTGAFSDEAHADHLHLGWR